MRIFICLFIGIILSGCAVTGTASKQDLQPLVNPPEFKASVDAVVILTDEKTADNESYGAFNWGRFNDLDKDTIHQSIVEPLGRHLSKTDRKAKVYVKLHRYAQVVTNASYASFVIVDWCLVVDGIVVHDEVFYAGHSDELNIFTGQTLGWAKSETHKAVSVRIINQVIEMLSEPNLKNAYPESHVYLNADEAVAVLPAQLTSVGNAFMSGGMYFFISPVTGNTDFDKKSAYQKVNWSKEIKQN